MVLALSKSHYILAHLLKFSHNQPPVEVLSDKLKCYFAHTEPKTLHLQPPLNTNVDHLQKFS